MPLYPGYTRCGNCGFDSAQQQPAWGAQPTYQQPAWGAQPAPPAPWAAQPAAQPARKSNLPIVLAIGGVLLLAAAGGLFVMMPKNTSSGSPSPSAIAAASATATATAAPPPSAVPVTAKPTATDTPTAAPATEEPSPDYVWTAFTAPDKKWSVRFPSSTAPVKQSQSMAIGTTTGTMTVYAVEDPTGLAVYAVAFVDFPAGALPGDVNSYLPLMDSAVAASTGGTLVSSSDSTVGKYTARDLTISKDTQTYIVRIWFVGNRFYMLMTGVEGDAPVYPGHFMATFALK